MQMISEESVEATWMEVGGWPPRRAKKEMGRLVKRQGDLLGFVTAFTEDLDPEAAELAVYMFFVICRMFQKSAQRPIRRIKAQRIMRAWEATEAMLERLEGAHEKFIERAAKVESSRQPYVIKYIVEALFEADEGEDPVYLTEEDTGVVFMVLKTVVDVLDDAVE